MTCSNAPSLPNHNVSIKIQDRAELSRPDIRAINSTAVTRDWCMAVGNGVKVLSACDDKFYLYSSIRI